ncbi:MAG: proton-conducting transporter membrane subunit [Acetobacteraceae bacterium]|nr:proton-conducting transporter membrane subunit [Acetobacteraceae bacterium]
MAAALAMAVSGNLALTGLAWLATGVGLRRLLTFYGHRPAAILCARKNLLVSRAADLILLVAAVLLWRAAGSLNYGDLFIVAAEWRGTGLPPSVAVASILIVIAALLKSAQLPVHGWLLEVMETPTPVSALLHAGIINAGGFLILRLSPIIGQAPGAMTLLAVMGAMTAILASLAMLTQTSVKVSLGWSTVAQMGFMMLELGLGAYAAALLHIVAHSQYKAHAFLSSGSVVELARAAWSPGPGERPHPRFALALVAALVIVLAVGHVFGADLAHAPGAVILGAVMAFGLTQLLGQAIDARPSRFVLLRVAGLAVTLAAAWFAMRAGTERLFAGVLPPSNVASSPFSLALSALVIASFAALTWFQAVAVGHLDGPRSRALHAHVANGFYLNTLANRWLLRLWPNPPRSPAFQLTPTAGEAP